MVGQARAPQVVPHAAKYAKHPVRYTLASKMRTESCLDLEGSRALTSQKKGLSHPNLVWDLALTQIFLAFCPTSMAAFSAREGRSPRPFW